MSLTSIKHTRRRDKPEVYLFQIYYDEATKSKLDPDFIPVDNLANSRPDWFEIWPILEYFREHPIDPESWYGFFSPRFREKTAYKGKKIYRWVRRHGKHCDVLVLSRHLRSRYKNVFEQAEDLHPGITNIAQQCFDKIGLSVNLRSFDTQGNRAIFSNYFVAKGWFWNRWIEIIQELVSLSENPNEHLSEHLNKNTVYRPGCPRAPYKIFIAERVASILLAENPQIRTIAKRPGLWSKIQIKLLASQAKS